MKISSGILVSLLMLKLMNALLPNSNYKKCMDLDNISIEHNSKGKICIINNDNNEEIFSARKDIDECLIILCNDSDHEEECEIIKYLKFRVSELDTEIALLQ